jgi:hypothetical protein
MPQTPVPGPPEPQVSTWDAIAQEAWPGGPSASKPPPPRSRRPAFGNGGRGDRHDPEGEDPATVSQPIYVWNPGASTENLPAVPPGENHNQ